MGAINHNSFELWSRLIGHNHLKQRDWSRSLKVTVIGHIIYSHNVQAFLRLQFNSEMYIAVLAVFVSTIYVSGTSIDDVKLNRTSVCNRGFFNSVCGKWEAETATTKYSTFAQFKGSLASKKRYEMEQRFLTVIEMQNN